jgi:hypothetical protein
MPGESPVMPASEASDSSKPSREDEIPENHRTGEDQAAANREVDPPA